MHANVVIRDRQTPKIFSRASPRIIKRPEHEITPFIRHDLIVACRGLKDLTRCKGVSVSISPENDVA
jgi:hypothetical protein